MFVPSLGSGTIPDARLEAFSPVMLAPSTFAPLMPHETLAFVTQPTHAFESASAAAGYRFLPEVVKTVENLPAVLSGDAIVVEEEIIQQIQIEETIEISRTQFDSNRNGKFYESNARAFPDSNIKALPAAPARLWVSPVWILPALLIFAALAFFAFRNFTRVQNPKITLAARVVPFSGLSGRETCPSFSPDGKQMVFSWNGGEENAKLNVYVKPVGAGEPVRLTTQETDDINLVFSPDGKSIAFVRVFPTHNEIVLIPALGGAERKIYERASYASISFSPDGKLLAHAELDAANNKAGIFTIDLETGEKAQITAPDAPVVDHTPRFTPDGKFLAFVRYFSSLKREIFVAPASGSGAAVDRKRRKQFIARVERRRQMDFL